MKLSILHQIHYWINTTCTEHSDNSEIVKVTGEVHIHSKVKSQEENLIEDPADDKTDADQDEGFHYITHGPFFLWILGLGLVTCCGNSYLNKKIVIQNKGIYLAENCKHERSRLRVLTIVHLGRFLPGVRALVWSFLSAINT